MSATDSIVIATATWPAFCVMSSMSCVGRVWNRKRRSTIPMHASLQFATNHPHISIVRVRSFDVATFVAFGGAQLAVAGSDVLTEFEYPEVYAPLDLGVGKCHLAVAEPTELGARDDPSRWSHVRVATKYPSITRRHFAARGVQAECIHLNGAMELASRAGLMPTHRRPLSRPAQPSVRTGWWRSSILLM